MTRFSIALAIFTLLLACASVQAFDTWGSRRYPLIMARLDTIRKEIADSTAEMRDLIGARADSATALYWPDTTVILTNVKALIGARADSATALYWPDTTVILTNVKNLIGARADSGTVVYWADTVATAATKSDIRTLYRSIQFTITDPKNLPGDSCIVWSNETGTPVTLLSIMAWSTTDNFTFSLSEHGQACEEAGETIADITIENDGTGCFYTTEVTSFAHALIEDENTIWYLASADSTGWVKVSIRYEIGVLGE